jgi:hypothetical protein
MIRIFTTISEILSQAFVLWSMSLSSARAFHTSQHWAELLIIGLAIFPTLFSFFNSCFAFPLSDRWSQSLQDSEDARLEERHERMRGLAYSDSFKPEVLLFGLRTWILQSWADAKRSLMIRSVSLGESTSTAARTFARTSAIEFFSLIQTARPPICRATLLLNYPYVASSRPAVLLCLPWLGDFIPDYSRDARANGFHIGNIHEAPLPGHISLRRFPYWAFSQARSAA